MLIFSAMSRGAHIDLFFVTFPAPLQSIFQPIVFPKFQEVERSLSFALRGHAPMQRRLH